MTTEPNNSAEQPDLAKMVRTASIEAVNVTVRAYQKPMFTRADAVADVSATLRADLTAARAELGKLGADYRELRDDSADIAKDNITLRAEVERLKEANASFAVTVKTYEALTTSLRATSEAFGLALENDMQLLKRFVKDGGDRYLTDHLAKERIDLLEELLARYRAATPAQPVPADEADGEEKRDRMSSLALGEGCAAVQSARAARAQGGKGT